MINLILNLQLEVRLADVCERTTFLDGAFTINSLNEIPIANPITEPLIKCHSNYSGTYDFDLNTDIAPVILKTQITTQLA